MTYHRLRALPLAPPGLLAALILVIAALSAVFSNDIICLAVAPVLADVCLARRLNPVPFLLALACAANVGSAATLIGNPQNMLIGGTLDLPFSGYMRDAALPVAVGLVLTWGWITWAIHGQWELAPTGSGPIEKRTGDEAPPFDFWQNVKGVGVATTVFALFPFAPLPREVVALIAAGLLLPAATYEVAGPVLALASTLAGNLLVVGSIANIIVINAAQGRGIRISWKEHARVGILVTLCTMAIAAAWLWLRLRTL